MQITTWGFWKLMGSGSIVGAVLAVGLVWLLIPALYVSTSVIVVRPPSASSQNYGQYVNELALKALSRKSLTAIIVQEHLYEKERTRKPFEDVIEQMKKNIRIRNAGNNVLEVQFVHAEPAKAQSATRALTASLMSANPDPAVTKLEILDFPKLPSDPIQPSYPIATGLGAVAGLALGLVSWAVLVRQQPGKA